MTAPDTTVLETVEAWLVAGARDRVAALCQSWVRARPREPAGLMALARLLAADGRVAEAADIARQAVGVAPQWLGGWLRLARLLSAAGDGAGALAAFEMAVSLAPSSENVPLDALNEATHLAKALARPDLAERFVRAAVAAAPDDWTWRFNHAVILLDQGRLADSVAALEAALVQRGESGAGRAEIADLLNDQGGYLKDAGQTEAAITAYRRALAFHPEAASIHSNLLLCLSYHGGLDRAGLLEEHRAYGRRFSRPFDPLDFPNDLAPDRTLRIGYVSPDFRRHVVAEMIEGLFEHHDPAAVDVFCYAEVARPDEVTARLRGQVSHWRSTVGLSDEAMAQLIREDRIDVLVDLAGHTAGNRLPVFGLKPAPVQVSWLGYPGTTGMPAIDHLMTSLPPGEIVEMPVFDPLTIYKPRVAVPDLADPPCLTRGYITFGCFNNAAKLNDITLDLWARILEALPTSRLILKALAFAEPWGSAAMRERWAARGIDPSRMELRGPSHYADFMAETADIDVALDPFPYGGSTTTLDMLYMGVPVLALEGQDSRAAAAGILNVLGLRELVTADGEAYVGRALRMAEDHEGLVGLRHGLRDHLRASAFMNSRALAGHLEASWRAVWQRWTRRKRGKAGIEPAGTGETAALLSDQADRLRDVGLVDMAITVYERALALSPDNASLHSNRLFFLSCVYGWYDQAEILENHRAYGRRFSLPFDPFDFPNDPAPDRRLRVGYVSPDFRRHIVAEVSEGLFSNHDREAFEIFCYAEVPEPDDATNRPRALVPNWRFTLGRTDEEVARMVREDRIDVLVDLAGHAVGNRLPVFGLKPAPVQISWLGYPNTTGMEAIDYLITNLPDEAIVEKAIDDRLSVYRLREEMPEVTPPPCLARGHVTFGGFGDTARVSDAVLDVWARILMALPTARLLLKAFAFGEFEEITAMRKRWVARGVDPGRIELRASPRYRDAMKDMSDIDIVLVPFPDHGSMDPFAMLGMGVPVIALEGGQGRGAPYGLLNRLDLRDLVVADADTYVACASRWATDPGRLARLRQDLPGRLRATMSADPAGATRWMETTLRTAWQTWTGRKRRGL